ncbi:MULTISPECIES: phosphopantetheine-binding protein, partial [unclassified Streptomyces]|uniref:acyl carrier protein n=1 Tax=unclassified Streptomyces TaxID=2593676 RepID=UPI00380B685B
RMGLVPLASADAMGLFDLAPATGEAVLAVTRLDLAGLRGLADPPVLLRGVVPGVVGRRVAAGGGVSSGGLSLVERLGGLSLVERRRVVVDVVRTHVAGVLGHADVSGVVGDRVFQDMGFDSLTAVELRNRLNSATGLRLPTTLVFDHPSPDALTAYLLEELDLGETSAAAAVLAELDRIEAAIRETAQSGTGTADPEQERIAARLRELLELAGSADGSAADEAEDKDLDAATDEELFALLDDME